MEFSRYKIGNVELDPDEDSQVVVIEGGKLTAWAADHWKWIKIAEADPALENPAEDDCSDCPSPRTRHQKRSANEAGLETN